MRLEVWEKQTIEILINEEALVVCEVFTRRKERSTAQNLNTQIINPPSVFSVYLSHCTKLGMQ